MLLLFACRAQTIRIVYIDPVGADAYSSWNNVSFATTNATTTLKDSLTNSTGIRLAIVTPLQGPNGNASTSPSGAASEFAPAGANSAYGNTNVFGGKVIPLGLAVFSNLTASIPYHFTFYGSRTGVSDNREALYTVIGANSGSNTLNAAGNSTKVTAVSNIYPRADGTITLRVERGSNNNETNGFFYLTAMKLAYEQPSEIPPPLSKVVYVDAAGTTASAGWNLVSFNATTAAIALSDTNGLATDIRLQVTAALEPALNASGTNAPTGAAAEFKPASIQNCFGHNTGYNGTLITNGAAVFSGLSNGVAYTFTFYASRMASGGENREALYSLTGATSASCTLNASENYSQIAAVSNVYPRPDGTLTLTVQKGPSNNSLSAYFYIAALKITYADSSSNPPPAIAQAGKRLLFFGNSFSLVDDVPGHVGSLAAIAGHPAPLVVADLMGGQDLAYHLTQVEGYPENNVTNAALTGTNTWDHVIIQGYSTEATHLSNTLIFRTNALALFQRVRNHPSGKGAGAGAVLYQTWARAPGHSFYPTTFANPAAMQLEIRTNYQAAAELIAAAEPSADLRLAPVGDAFERDAFIPGDLYAADLYHAGNLGPRLAAMILYKTIYSATVTNIPYAAAVAAGWTTMSSNDWTRVTYWAEGLMPPGSPASTNLPPAAPGLGARETFLIDTANGDAAAVPGWNAVAFTTLNSATLVQTNGYETDVTCTVLTRMNSINLNGSASPSGNATVFAPAGANSAYGNVNPFGSYSNLYAQARFSGLKPSRRYTFTLFASRLNPGDNREALYTLTGANSGSSTLNAANNTAQVAVVENIVPRPDGTIDLRIQPGPNNTSSSKFYHVSAIKIESVRSGLLLMIGP